MVFFSNGCSEGFHHLTPEEFIFYFDSVVDISHKHCMPVKVLSGPVMQWTHMEEDPVAFPHHGGVLFTSTPYLYLMIKIL